MRLVVFGASGKVGGLVVAEALSRGHQVCAFTHSSPKLAGQSAMSDLDKLEIVQGDVHSLDDVRRAIQDREVVISTLGSWGTRDKDIVTAGTINIIKAMDEQGIERLVSLTGAEAATASDVRSLIRITTHTLARIAAGKILRDGENHIRALQNSALDWTVLRSPVMTNSPEIFYRLTLKPGKPWQTIPRKAVAKAIVDQIDGPGYSRSAPFIYRQASRF